VQSQKSPAISVTLLTSHESIGPYRSSAACLVAGLHNMSTARLSVFVVNSTGLVCIAGCAVGRFGATAERAPRFKPTICFPSAEHVTAALPQGSVREIKVSPNPRESFKLCQDAHSAASNLAEAPVQIGAWAETNGATA
jgi:hypothetical protein